jgi:hypothetical protein
VGSFVEVDIAADVAAYPSWKEPIKTYFRRTEQGWTLVGLERLPEMVPFEQTLEAAAH